MHDAIQIAEEVGSTLASASSSLQMKKHKRSVAVPVYVAQHQRNGDYTVPMNLAWPRSPPGSATTVVSQGTKPPTAGSAKQLRNQLLTVLLQVSNVQNCNLIICSLLCVWFKILLSLLSSSSSFRLRLRCNLLKRLGEQLGVPRSQKTELLQPAAEEQR